MSSHDMSFFRPSDDTSDDTFTAEDELLDELSKLGMHVTKKAGDDEDEEEEEDEEPIPGEEPADGVAEPVAEEEDEDEEDADDDLKALDRMAKEIQEDGAVLGDLEEEL